MSVLRVGMTFDYKPFSYRGLDESPQGLDVQVAELFAERNSYKLEFIPTTWKTLHSDLLSANFEIAMSGISFTKQRAELFEVSHSYLKSGKCPLVRSSFDFSRFHRLIDFNTPRVLIGVNPGGTNEAFVNSSFPKAKVIVFENNLEIPERVADGTVDIMFTDSVEATLMARKHPSLRALIQLTFTDESFVYLARKNAEGNKLISELNEILDRDLPDDRLSVLLNDAMETSCK